jgi:hypothetical protein
MTDLIEITTADAILTVALAVFGAFSALLLLHMVHVSASETQQHHEDDDDTVQDFVELTEQLARKEKDA